MSDILYCVYTLPEEHTIWPDSGPLLMDTVMAVRFIINWKSA